VTGHAWQSLARFSVLALALAASATIAPAAEIIGASSRIALTYDEAHWSARLNDNGDPELICQSEACGGETATCGTLLIARDGDGQADQAFLERFRQNIDDKTIEAATINKGTSSRPEIVIPASAMDFGGKTGVFTSMRIVIDQRYTRIDNFWRLAGPDIAGIACVVSESGYDRARPAFERVYENLTIHIR
jgi:hypothetical protein